MTEQIIKATVECLLCGKKLTTKRILDVSDNLSDIFSDVAYEIIVSRGKHVVKYGFICVECYKKYFEENG